MQIEAAPLSEMEALDLRCIAGMMIPASAEFGVPGADDPIILADIAASAGRDIGYVRQALGRLASLAGGPFAALDRPRCLEVAAAFLADDGAAVAQFGRIVLQCYYRDDRVLRSLGREPRPPFPIGNQVEQGDWSLLDPVRGRPRMWREA